MRFGLQPDAPRLAGASAQLQWRHQLRRDITRSTHRHRRRWQPGTPAPAPAPAPAAAPAPALSRSLATLATTLATLATLAPLPPRLPGLLLGPRVLRVREALHPAGEPSAHLRPSSDPPDVPPSLRPGTPAALLKTRHAGHPPQTQPVSDGRALVGVASMGVALLALALALSPTPTQPEPEPEPSAQPQPQPQPWRSPSPGP